MRISDLLIIIINHFIFDFLPNFLSSS